MAERGYSSTPDSSRISAFESSPRSISGNTEKRYCCSSADGAWARPFKARITMSKLPATSLTLSFPKYNSRICTRAVSTAGWFWRCYTGSIMVLLVLMLWTGGAPASAASAAQAHLGSGNQLLQAERYRDAADEFQLALRDHPSLAQAAQQLAVCYFELRDYARA